MCGISGVFHFNGAGGEQRIRDMAKALNHRGPDACTFFLRDRVQFAHNRLSIIDIEGGNQPFIHEARDLALVANGEVYNFVELREQLQAAGCVFQTHSDCEVILHAYDLYGDNFVSYLRGMYAFALYDGQRRRVILGRDRMGEKPLYYSYEDGVFLFSSELQSILAGRLTRPPISQQGVLDFFRYQYIPEPDTLFEGIHKLPRAAIKVIELDRYRTDIRNYWNPWRPEAVQPVSQEEFYSTLNEAIDIASRSDVPLGISLSGGLDSSLLAAQIHAVADQPLSAISLGYEGMPSVDERSKAKWLSNRLGIEFIDVEISNNEVVELFEDTCNRRDEPVGDIAGISYNAIMRAAHENNIRVMFAGQGADELFWGYEWVRKAAVMNSRDKKCSPALFKRLFSRRKNDSETGFNMFDLQPFTKWVLQNESAIFPFATDGKLKSPIETYGTLTGDADIDVVRLISDFYLIGNGISQMDRIAMSHSVEARLPFLDYKFVECAINIQHGRGYFSQEPKLLLKQFAHATLPEEVLARPKQGFSPPVPLWQKKLREAYGERLVEGHLCKQGLIGSQMARSLSQTNINNPVEATVSRLALTLEVTLAKHLIS